MLEIFCKSCGTSFQSQSPLKDHFCSTLCDNRFTDKIKSIRFSLRIAELDYCSELDPILFELSLNKELTIDRYYVPYDIFKVSSQVGLEFPIATLDCDSIQIFRKYGIHDVSCALNRLKQKGYSRTSSLATRATKKLPRNFFRKLG